MPGPQSYCLRSLTSQSPAVLVQDNAARSTHMKPFCNTTGQNVASYSVIWVKMRPPRFLTTTAGMGNDSEKQNEK